MQVIYQIIMLHFIMKVSQFEINNDVVRDI